MSARLGSFAPLEVGNLPSSKGELASDTAMRLDVGIYYQRVVSTPKWVVSGGMGGCLRLGICRSKCSLRVKAFPQ